MNSIISRSIGAAKSSLNIPFDQVARRLAADPLFGGTGRYASMAHTITGAAGQVASVNLASAQEQYRHYSGWVHAATRVIGQAIAAQPIHVARLPRASAKSFNKTKSFGNGLVYTPGGVFNKGSVTRQMFMKRTLPGSLKGYYETAELLESHPIMDVLQYPNPIMTKSALMFVTAVSMELTGKGYWWIEVKNPEEKDSGDPTPVDSPVRIWYLPSHWVEPVHLQNKLFACWKVMPDGVGSPFYVPRNQMVYFPQIDPSNPFGTYATLQAQARAVIADEAISEAQRQTFSRGIFPGYAVVMGDIQDADGNPKRPLLKANQRAQMIQIIKKMYQGVLNFDEPVILDRLVSDMKRLSNLPQEMAFQESGNYTKAKITQGHGVNPIVMGQIEQANRASAAAAKDNLYDVAVNPRIALMSEVLSMWFSPLFAQPGEQLLLYIEECRASDPETDQKIVDSLAKQGAITRNESRAVFNMPPIDNGDNMFVQENTKLVPLSMTAEEYNVMTPKTVNGKETVQADTDGDGSGDQTVGMPPGTESNDKEPPVNPDATDQDAKRTTPKAKSVGYRRKSITTHFPDNRMCENFDCGVTEVRSVCELYGMCPGWTNEDFMTALKASEVIGTTPKHIVNFFRHHACEVVEKPEATVHDLILYVEQKGWPVLCPIQYTDADGVKHGHWVTVTGVKGEPGAATVEFHCSIDGPNVLAEMLWDAQWIDFETDGTPRKQYLIAVGPPPNNALEVTVSTDE